MHLKNSAQYWGAVAWLFHWVLAVLIVWMIFQGNEMEGMEMGDEKIAQIFLHKSMGVLILLLVLLRLAWRSANPVPAPLENTPPLKVLASRINHWLLYLLLLLQPISGLVMSTSAGYPPNFFGLWQFPQWLPKNESLAETLNTVHATGWWLLALLAGLHVLAALHHHFVVRDRVLRRMLFPS